ncbi:MAG: glycosyltransferase family 9 protein [Candidatus Aegiribacteria sp.]|nr:glycosyltransferase family 9 protein [Candidatus Aegiribacteria sp.]
MKGAIPISEMPGVLKKLEILGRKMLHRALFSRVSYDGVPGSVPDDERLERILLLRQDRIGDMIMTLPLIRRLRELYPCTRIGIVASESNRIILKYETGLDIITYRKNPGGFISSLVQARNFNPDAVVDMHMHDSTTSFIYALSSGARWRLHIDRENRLPFNVRVSAPQDGHIMEAFAGLLSGLGRKLETTELKREVSLSKEETDFAEDFWNRSAILPGDCAAVNISAGGENRRWGADRYARVCSRILDMGLKPLILYSPTDHSAACAVHQSEPDVLISPVTPSILHLAALIRGVTILVSPDTSVIHLAASSGIPVVGMFLPFDPSLPKWYPQNVKSEILMASDNISLDSVSPEIVSGAVRTLVSNIVRGIQIEGDQ